MSANAPDPMVQRAMQEMGCEREGGLVSSWCTRPDHRDEDWTDRGCGYAARIADALYRYLRDNADSLDARPVP